MSRPRWWLVEQAVLTAVGARKGTRHQDLFEDIDGVRDSDGCTFSVKNQEAAAKTGNISFELEVHHRDRGWVPGNFAYGKAQKYIIVIGTTAHGFLTAGLHDYLERRKKAGTLAYRGLRNDTKAAQKRIGHPHIDVRNALIPLEDLLACPAYVCSFEIFL